MEGDADMKDEEKKKGEEEGKDEEMKDDPNVIKRVG